MLFTVCIISIATFDTCSLEMQLAVISITSEQYSSILTKSKMSNCGP